MIDKILYEQPDGVQWLTSETITKNGALKLIARANPPQGNTKTRFTLDIAKHLPELLLGDQPFWDEVFAMNRKYFWRIPEKNRSSYMCLHAVKDNPFNLRLIPVTKQTREICAIAIEAEAFLIDRIKEEFRTPEMQYAFIKSHTAALLGKRKTEPTERMLLKCIDSIAGFNNSCA